MSKYTVLPFNPVYTPASIDVDLPFTLTMAGLPPRMKLFTRFGSNDVFSEYHVTTLATIIEHFKPLMEMVNNRDEERDFHITINAVNVDYEFKVENIECRLDERFPNSCVMRCNYSKYEVTDQHIIDELSHSRFVDNPDTLYYIGVLYNQTRGIMGFDGRAKTPYHAHNGKVVDGFTQVYALIDRRYKEYRV